jgi:hypothetical protein
MHFPYWNLKEGVFGSFLKKNPCTESRNKGMKRVCINGLLMPITLQKTA